MTRHITGLHFQAILQAILLAIAVLLVMLALSQFVPVLGNPLALLAGAVVAVWLTLRPEAAAKGLETGRSCR
jgi:hypothetical protein